MKHNILYCNTKKNGFITMVLTNPKAFFHAIPHVNDNERAKPESVTKENQGLWNLAKDMVTRHKEKLRRDIFGTKGDCQFCGGWIDYLGEGKWGCERCFMLHQSPKE